MVIYKIRQLALVCLAVLSCLPSSGMTRAGDASEKPVGVGDATKMIKASIKSFSDADALDLAPPGLLKSIHAKREKNGISYSDATVSLEEMDERFINQAGKALSSGWGSRAALECEKNVKIDTLIALVAKGSADSLYLSGASPGYAALIQKNQKIIWVPASPESKRVLGGHESDRENARKQLLAYLLAANMEGFVEKVEWVSGSKSAFVTVEFKEDYAFRQMTAAVFGDVVISCLSTNTDLLAAVEPDDRFFEYLRKFPLEKKVDAGNAAKLAPTKSE
jgi:hypothetical protein